MLLPTGVSADGLFLRSPEAIDPSDHWHQAIPGDFTGGLPRAGNDMLLIVVDGGYGDLDHTADGKITLEIAPATGFLPGHISGRLFNGHADQFNRLQFDEVLPMAGTQLYLDWNNSNTYDASDSLLTHTDSNGAYDYTGLLRSSYRIGVVPPAGWQEVGAYPSILAASAAGSILGWGLDSLRRMQVHHDAAP
jgi:hypothetical protein